MMSPPKASNRSWISFYPRTVAPAVVLIAVFLLLAVAVHLRLLADIDLAFAQSVYYGLDSVVLLYCATATGILLATQTALIYSLAASLVLWRRGMGIQAFAPMAFLFGTAVEVLFKIAVNQPQEPLSEFHRGTFYPFFGLALNGSYPSGHALRTAFFCFFLGALLWSRGGVLPRIVSLGAIPLALFFSFTRLYIGDHWLSDIVGGLLLGTAIAVLVVPPVAHRLARNVPDPETNGS